MVPNDQLSLAIGKRGQNVRLASRLTSWDIDIITESEFEERQKEGAAGLTEVAESNKRPSDNSKTTNGGGRWLSILKRVGKKREYNNKYMEIILIILGV